MQNCFKISVLLNLALVFLIVKSTNAQKNLVPNHSFENYIVCPNYSTGTPPLLGFMHKPLYQSVIIILVQT